jgi:hypothetical protein
MQPLFEISLSDLPIHRVHPAGMDPDQNIIMLRLRLRGFFVLQHLGTTVLMNAHCFHNLAASSIPRLEKRRS